jgi:hypothetical protein
VAELSVPLPIIIDMSDVIPQTLRALAGDQAGVVTRQQALGAAMPSGAIAAKIRFGRWQRVHAGVYATFTGPVTRDARLWAAVLAAGPGAQLSHQTAAEINRLTDRESPDGSRGYRDRYDEEYKLIVELDGKRYHPPEHRGRDQDWDNDAAATVGATLRYGWVDVTSKRCGSARQVHAALAKQGYAGPFTPCSPTCTAFAHPAGRQAWTAT